MSVDSSYLNMHIWKIWSLLASTTSLVAQMEKRLSTMRETRVQSLGWEDPLEKEMAIHSSNIAWKIPWTEEPGTLQSMGTRKESDTTERLHVHVHINFNSKLHYTNLHSQVLEKLDFSI